MWLSMAALNYSCHLLQWESLRQCCFLLLPHSPALRAARSGLESPVGSRSRVRNKLTGMNGLDLDNAK